MTSRQSWKYKRMSDFMGFPYLDGLFLSFFELWRLAIFEPVGVQRHNVPHFKGLIVLYLDSRSSRAWQHFYLPPRPLEKGLFSPKNGYCAVWFEYSCIKTDKGNLNELSKGKLNQPCTVSTIMVGMIRKSRRYDKTIRMSKCECAFCNINSFGIKFS